MKQIKSIISIDGGGIRGIIPALVLVELERILQQKTNDANARVVQHFDLFAATVQELFSLAFFYFPMKTEQSQSIRHKMRFSFISNTVPKFFIRALYQGCWPRLVCYRKNSTPTIWSKFLLLTLVSEKSASC